MILALLAAMVAPVAAPAATFTRIFRVPEPIWDFTDPQDAVRDTDGTIWLVDNGRQRLVQLAPDGHELMSVGGPGDTDGYFYGPRNVAIGPDGLVYVIDCTGRLQRFTRDGVFVSSVVLENLKPYNTARPSGLCIDSEGSVYVSDAWTGSVQKLREDGSTERSYPGALMADDVVVAEDGTVYVSDPYWNEILVFEAEGTLLRRFEVEHVMGDYQSVSGLALAPDGTLVIAVSGAIVRMTTTGEYLGTIASEPLTNPYAVPSPGGISVDSDGGILWTYARHALRIFSPDGTLVGSYRSTGSSPFDSPYSFAFYGDTTYMTDAQALLHRLTPEGSIISTSALPVASPYNPKSGAVAVDASGTAYVTDPDLNSVWRFAPTGEFLGSFYDEWNIGPGIAFSGDGALYIANGTSVHRFESGEATPSATWRSLWPSVLNYSIWQPLAITPEGDILTGQQWTYQCDAVVRRFTASGEHVRDFGTLGSLPGQLNAITSLAVDREGRIFVADYRNNRIQWFSPEGTFWGEFGGTRDTPFSKVRAVAFDPQGRLWVGYNNTVASFEVDGIAPPSIDVTPAVPAVDESSTVDVQSVPGERSLILLQTSGDGVTWKTQSTHTAPASGRVQVSGLRFQETTHVRVLERSSRGDRVTAYSRQVKRVPKAIVSTPAVPDVVVRGATFNVRSSVRPVHASGTYPLRFNYWRWESGGWKGYGYVTGKATAKTTYSQVDASLKLPSTGKWRVRAYHEGDSSTAAAWSPGYDYVTVKTRPVVGTPKAPSSATTSAAFRVYGSLTPRHAKDSYPVRIYKWRKTSSGAWKSYGYSKAKASNYYSYSKYAASVRLPNAGRWRLRAYAPADSGHVAAWSTGFDYVTVR